MSLPAQIFPITCGIQTYNWGKVGSSSYVASLLKSSHQVAEVDESMSYAELWMGTHPKTPCHLQTGTPLPEFLKNNPGLVGDEILEEFGPTLPFLMKVLSIGHPLQIQIHPTKAEAEKLHSMNPSAFLDSNHKPEMAVALTPFTALCGFRQPAQVLQFAQKIPEFGLVLGDDTIAVLKNDEKTDKEKIEACYNALFRTSRDFTQLQNQFIDRIARRDNASNLAKEDDLCDTFKEIHDTFPGNDPAACFGIFLLNLLHLEPGEAIWVPAGEVHAYLSGDCLEVLSCGDNVLFCGFVSPADISHFPSDLTNPDLLATIVNFNPTKQPKVEPTKKKDGSLLYSPPVREFSLSRVVVEEKESVVVHLEVLETISTVLVQEGEGEIQTPSGSLFFRPGCAFIVPKGVKAEVKCGGSGVTIYRASIGNKTKL